MKTKIIAIVIVLLCLSGSVGYGLWQSRKNARRTQALPVPAASESPIATQQPATPLTSQGQALGVNTNGNQSTALQSNLGQSSSDASSGSAKTPGPESFGQYDKYKDGETALFGDLQVGTGTEATAGKTVAVVYKGWLTNGTLFDESKVEPKSGKLQAFQFTLGQGQVVTGWEQGVPGMKVGGIRRIIVPPSVGYGAEDHGPVPGGSVMVFDVQMVAVE